jgi:hypothetical protein
VNPTFAAGPVNGSIASLSESMGLLAAWIPYSDAYLHFRDAVGQSHPHVDAIKG